MPAFSILVAVDLKNGIGRAGRMPWHLPEDLAHFRRLTTGRKGEQNAVIMGRQTWMSLPESRRPLRDRINVIVTRSMDTPSGALCALSLDDALVQTRHATHRFVIGGERLFQAAIHHPDLIEIHLTRVRGHFQCDRFFPKIPTEFELSAQSKTQRSGERNSPPLTYEFCVYRRR